jgi:ribosomal-protein-alanine N-acetyltransferase
VVGSYSEFKKRHTDQRTLLIVTNRLEIVPVTLDLARAEIRDRARFSELLGATVPDNWPPETLADALGFFLDLLERNPSWSNWLGWYALLRTDP